MRILKTLFIAVILMSQPIVAFSQNWMMAQKYAEAAIDTISNSNYDDALDFEGYLYESFTYNPVSHEYSLNLKADALMLDSTATAVMYVGLNGGIATLTDDLFSTFEVEIPDWSQDVFIYNATDSKITFSLSCNDSDFYNYDLNKGTFNHYQCSSEYVYVKVGTKVGDAITGQVHYKLEKGKGYKVEWDAASSKFEVFSDDRLK